MAMTAMGRRGMATGLAIMRPENRFIGMERGIVRLGVRILRRVKGCIMIMGVDLAVEGAGARDSGSVSEHNILLGSSDWEFCCWEIGSDRVNRTGLALVYNTTDDILNDTTTRLLPRFQLMDISPHSISFG